MVVAESRAQPRRVELVDESIPERILSVGASWMTAQSLLVNLVAELDATGEWQVLGSPTCAHWVADALDIELCTAREWLRVGKTLRNLPNIGAAFDSGLSYSKVRTLTRVATAENESELLSLAWCTPAGRLGAVLAKWLIDREEPEETRRRQRAARSVSWRTDPDGMIFGSFRLAAVEGKLLTSAIDTLVSRFVPGGAVSSDASADASFRRWPSIAQQRADALVKLLTQGGGHFVTEVVINLRGDGATYDDGTPIPWCDLERMLPEAFVRALIHDAEGRPINASARRRSPSTRQKRVVMAQDRACVDCGSTEFLEYDHDPPFEQSGQTVVDELVPRCRTCHRTRHRDDCGTDGGDQGDRAVARQSNLTAE